MEKGKSWMLVVPCENCRFSGEMPEQSKDNFLLCNLHRILMKPGDYCSDGKLKGYTGKKKVK